MSPTFPLSPLGPPLDERESLGRHWFLFLVLGLLSVIVGMLAIGSKWIAGLVSVKVFGWLLVIAGIAEVVHAVMVRNLRGFALHLLAAALYLLVGVFMHEDPVRAGDVIALLLAASFFVGGGLRILFSLAVRFPAWPWSCSTGWSMCSSASSS